MKWEIVSFVIILVLGISLAVATLLYSNLQSERDALRLQVARLYDAGDRVDSLNTELRAALGDCSDMLKVFVPPDTTKKFVRPRNIPGLDTMPVITRCTLFTRSGWPDIRLDLNVTPTDWSKLKFNSVEMSGDLPSPMPTMGRQVTVECDTTKGEVLSKIPSFEENEVKGEDDEVD